MTEADTLRRLLRIARSLLQQPVYGLGCKENVTYLLSQEYRMVGSPPPDLAEAVRKKQIEVQHLPREFCASYDHVVLVHPLLAVVCERYGEEFTYVILDSNFEKHAWVVHVGDNLDANANPSLAVEDS